MKRLLGPARRFGLALIALGLPGFARGQEAPAAKAGPPAPVSFPRKYDLSRPGARDFRIPQAGCFTCHPSDGKGVSGRYPPLAGSEWVNGNERRLIRILLGGLRGPISVSTISYPEPPDMPSFGKSGSNWSDQKIADVLTYIRRAWSNEADPVLPETVARVRAEAGDHGPWTAAELKRVR